jgi:hypothetical protein
MMNAPSAELSCDIIIERIISGDYPREAVETFARGFLPLPQDDLIVVLAYLTRSSDAEIAAAARSSLADVPSRSTHSFAANESLPPAHLSMLLRASEDPFVLEALIRNRAVPDALVVELAAVADAAVQEVVAINQARIIRTPGILDALLANPQLTPDVRRRALETREEFFDKKARIAAQQPAEVEVEVGEDEAMLSLSDEPIADLLEKAAQEPESDSPPPALMESEKLDEKKLSVFSQILLMSVSEKVQTGFKGGKTERMILIRDHNRLVCGAVMRNPRMSESEVESIASMRNIAEEVLRLITLKREWISKYNIVATLTRNPKCPVGVVLPLINRLTLRDLKGLKDDKGVSETVRGLARKVYIQRTQKS